MMDPTLAILPFQGTGAPAGATSTSEAVANCLASGRVNIVLLLDHISRLDTASIAALIGLHRRIRAAGGHLTLATTREDIRRTLKVTGLASTFHLIERVDQIPLNHAS